jgi:hypothetical protein
MQLLQNGRVLCDVTRFDFKPGETPIRYISQIGGPSVPVRGRPTPDLIHLLLPILPQFTGNLAEIREGTQNRPIVIASINATNSTGVIVQAVGL